MKARPIPPPEKVDTRTEAQKEADRKKAIENIKTMQELLGICAITGHDYFDGN